MFQKGRTLLEMLAVLAIFGTLSIGAFSAIQWALAKVKANEIINHVYMLELAALDTPHLYEMQSGELTLTETEQFSRKDYFFRVFSKDSKVFHIDVFSISPRICRLLLDVAKENELVLAVNDVRYIRENICTKDNNTVAFYFSKFQDKIENICIPDCLDEQMCCAGSCHMIQTPCGSDPCMDCGSEYCIQNVLCCPNPTDLVCNGTICCDKNKGLTCGDTGCVCMNGRAFNSETGQCDCPNETYPFNEEELCCEAGYTPLDGSCQQVICSGGSDGQNNWSCKLNNVLCGTGCDSLGHNCTRGICWSTDCPTGYPFKRLDNKWFWGGGEGYGCLIPGTNCYTSTKNTACFSDPNNNTCCNANLQGECIDTGLCDPNVCKQFPDGLTSSTYFHSGWDTGCRFDNQRSDGDVIFCKRASATQWSCYLSQAPTYGGTLCGTCDIPPCSDCLNKNVCELMSVGMYEDENGYCCKDFEKGTLCRRKTYHPACLVEDGVYYECGISVNWNTGYTAVGDCFPVDCIDGFTWQRLPAYNTNPYYGCVNASKDMWYYRINSTYSYVTSAGACGNNCQKDRTGCSPYFQEACAPIDAETGKRTCIYGKAVTDTCVCLTDRTLAVGTLCCATGQTNINGVCVAL